MGSISPEHAVRPFSLDGKIALVTGASRGIGASVAVELARNGANVVVNYSHSSGAAEKVVQDIKSLGSDAIAIKADVSNVKEIIGLFDAAIEHYGRLDIVSSNAGVVSFGHLEDVTEEEFDRVFRLNTRGQFFVAREAAKRLGAGGRIILMSSNTAKDFVVPKHSVYSGSKGAIESFIPVMALDCGKKKITVNGVAPGGTVTDMFHAVAKHYIPNSENMSIDDLKAMAAHASPLVRCGYPIDVANVVCFLSSKEAEWINGKVLGIDGGAA